MALVDQLAGGNAPSTLPDFGGDKGGNTPLFGGIFGTPTYLVGPDTSNMFKDLYADSSNRPGALIASWIKGEITFEELKAAIPDEEFRNLLLGQFGYNPEGNPLAPIGVGEPVWEAPEEEGKKTETEPEEEPVDEGNWWDNIEIPTWEEVWDKLKDAVTPDTVDIGDILRNVLEGMGVDLPSGDISDILAGGYGVRWDPANTVFTQPKTGQVFVPGVPVGGPPTSVDIGTIDELLKDPTGTISERINKILTQVKDVATSPEEIINSILTGATDVPTDILGAILAGSVTAEVIDWVTNTFGKTEEQPTPVPPISGATDSGEEEPEPAGLAFGHEWSDEPIAGPEITPEVLDLNNYATIDPDLTGDGEFTRTGGESILSFGPEFVFDTDTEVINGTLDDPTQEVLSDSGSDSGTGGGGGGGGAGTSEDFLRGLSYRPLQVAPVAARPVVDYTAGLFTQPTSRMGNLQLGNITAGLFGDMIG